MKQTYYSILFYCTMILIQSRVHLQSCDKPCRDGATTSIELSLQHEERPRYTTFQVTIFLIRSEVEFSSGRATAERVSMCLTGPGAERRAEGASAISAPDALTDYDMGDMPRRRETLRAKVNLETNFCIATPSSYL